jgi:hypothetical protein
MLFLHRPHVQFKIVNKNCSKRAIVRSTVKNTLVFFIYGTQFGCLILMSRVKTLIRWTLVNGPVSDDVGSLATAAETAAEGARFRGGKLEGAALGSSASGHLDPPPPAAPAVAMLLALFGVGELLLELGLGLVQPRLVLLLPDADLPLQRLQLVH